MDADLPHAISLYYDFAGAIDNIYASLVSWLVLARDFGRVRLWSERAEFEIGDKGLCGLRKVSRPGGFAHMDVYFEAETPAKQRGRFISFVEEHLQQHGIEIREHVALTCPCGHQFSEDTLRQRIARGDKDVACPVCETRHSLAEGAAETRDRDASVMQRVWALKTEIAKRRRRTTAQAVQTIQKTLRPKSTTAPIRLLHLSDLHFSADTQVQARLQPLLADLRAVKCLKGPAIERLDYLVVSGDFAHKGSSDGLDKAYEFVSELTEGLGLSAEGCVFVPGNHDIKDLDEAFEWVVGISGERVGARSAKYPERLKPFSDGFFHKFLQKPYPLVAAEQALVTPFWETGIQFIGLNSCWQIDQYNRKNAGIHPEAVANALTLAHKQETDARRAGALRRGASLLKIAIWHHAVEGPEMMRNVDFLENLKNAGVRLAVHGDVHEVRRNQHKPWAGGGLYVAGAGAFGAASEDRPESTPRLYNLLEIQRDLGSVRVHTRQQPRAEGAWSGLYEWPDPEGGDRRVPYYDIQL